MHVSELSTKRRRHRGLAFVEVHFSVSFSPDRLSFLSTQNRKYAKWKTHSVLDTFSALMTFACAERSSKTNLDAWLVAFFPLSSFPPASVWILLDVVYLVVPCSLEQQTSRITPKERQPAGQPAGHPLRQSVSQPVDSYSVARFQGHQTSGRSRASTAVLRPPGRDPLFGRHTTTATAATSGSRSTINTISSPTLFNNPTHRRESVARATE